MWRPFVFLGKGLKFALVTAVWLFSLVGAKTRGDAVDRLKPEYLKSLHAAIEGLKQDRQTSAGARSANRSLCSTFRIAVRSAGASARGWTRSACRTGAAYDGAGLVRCRRY